MRDNRAVAPSRVLLRIAPFVVAASLVAAGCTEKVIVTNPPAATGGTARRESVPCKTGEATLPIEAFDINPDPATGTACDVANVLDDDGNAAGLAWSGGSSWKLAGTDVTGCVVAEFGDGITLDSLKMKMRPIAGACGHSCTEGGDEGCGTGWKVSIFAGPSIEKLKWVQQLSLTQAEPFEYSVFVYDTFKAKFVAVCREPTAATGDDIAIDALFGTCR